MWLMTSILMKLHTFLVRQLVEHSCIFLSGIGMNRGFIVENCPDPENPANTVVNFECECLSLRVQSTIADSTHGACATVTWIPCDFEVVRRWESPLRNTPEDSRAQKDGSMWTSLAVERFQSTLRKSCQAPHHCSLPGLTDSVSARLATFYMWLTSNGCFWWFTLLSQTIIYAMIKDMLYTVQVPVLPVQLAAPRSAAWHTPCGRSVSPWQLRWRAGNAMCVNCAK